MEALRVRPFWATFAVCATQYLTAVTFVCACVFSTQCAHSQYVMVPAQPYIQSAPVAGMPMGRMGGGRPMMQAQPSMSGSPSRGQSENFIVLCNDPALTEVVSKTAEKLRRDLAMHGSAKSCPLGRNVVQFKSRLVRGWVPVAKLVFHCSTETLVTGRCRCKAPRNEYLIACCLTR